jgi:beta-glucanase (GH16 family)
VEKRAGYMYDDPTLTHREYTSAYLNTFDKWTQLYGYFEARIKLPTTRGLWPAFWMMPDRGRSEENIRKRSTTDNNAMEIDIMEQLAEWGPGRYNVAAHWDNYGPEHKRWGSSFNYFGATPDNWHTFGALWEPGKITWYCDGIKKAEWADKRVGSVPMFMILNVQMGGWATKDVDDAKLPDAMQVDYVRAWQLKDRIVP